tara:strand:+ start:361 stop:894 length:534 start_codon:yes stop_codon:yes gene_type:complete
MMLAVVSTTAGLPYSYQTYSSEGQDDGTVEVGVTITPNSGWKWNTKYPAKFKVRLADGTTTEPERFAGGEINKALKVSGETTVIATFSVCDVTTCKVLRNQEFLFSLKSPARNCQTCHGKDLSGKKKNPPLRGLSYDKLYGSLTSEVPKKMKRIAKKLTEQEKRTISKYISGLGGAE